MNLVRGAHTGGFQRLNQTNWTLAHVTTDPNLAIERNSSGERGRCSHFETTGPLSRGDPFQLSPELSGIGIYRDVSPTEIREIMAIELVERTLPESRLMRLATDLRLSLRKASGRPSPRLASGGRIGKSRLPADQVRMGGLGVLVDGLRSGLLGRVCGPGIDGAGAGAGGDDIDSGWFPGGTLGGRP